MLKVNLLSIDLGWHISIMWASWGHTKRAIVAVRLLSVKSPKVS